MSLEKAIKRGKEHRKEYTGAKAIAKSCRNHGGCPWCEGNRTHKYKVAEDKLLQREKDFKKGNYDD